MRKILFQISALLCLTFSGLAAQEAILADQTSGCDSLTVQFTVVNVPDIGTISTVEWDFGDGQTRQGTLSATHTYTSTGIFSVQAHLDGVFDVTQEELVTVGAAPYADFSYKLTNSNGDELEYTFRPQHFNSVEGIGLNYYWQFVNSQDTTKAYDSSVVYAIIKKDTCFVSLQITDAVGCMGVLENRMVLGADSLLVPNVFSPNGDGRNDFFKVTTSGDQDWEMQIFSPNGLQVFSSNSPQIIWNGRTIGNDEAPEGAYFYVIVNGNNSEEYYTGFIRLYR